MNSKNKRIVLTLCVLGIFSLTNFVIPITLGIQDPSVNPAYTINGVGSYAEDFTSTTFMDVATTAFGWGSGIVTNTRDLECIIRDHYITDSPVVDVDVQGRKAYAALYNTSTTNSITILNINDIDDIKYLGAEDYFTHTTALAVEGDYLYSGHLNTIVNDAFVLNNVINPTNPNWFQGYGMDNHVTDIDIYGQLVFYTAYNVTNNRSLRFVDVEDPTTSNFPIQCQWDCNKSLGLDITGGLGYIAASTEGFYILNMTNKYTPVEEGYLDTPGNATSVLVDGKYAYVADGSEGFHIIDIQDSTNPIITDSFDTPGYARKLALQGNTLYVADSEGGVQIFDVSNPEQIIHVTDIALPHTYDVALFGGDLVVGAEDGVYTISVGTIANIADTWYPNPYEAPTIWDVRVVDGIAYLACGYDGIHVVDVNNPNQPVLLSNYTLGTFVDIRKIDINGKFLYAVSSNSYFCLDISNPADIKLIFSHGGGGLTDIFVHGETFYIGFTSGFAMVNVSNNYATSIISNYMTGINLNNTAIWVQGTHVYMVEGNSAGVNTLSCFKVTDYTAPINEYSTYRVTPMYDIQVDGDVAYLGAGGWFSIYNVSDPTLFTYPGYEITPSWGVWSFGRYVVSAERDEGVRLYDVTNVSNPTALSHYPGASDAIQITTSGDYTYAACKTSLVILRHFFSAADTYTTGGGFAQSINVGLESKKWITTATLQKVDNILPETAIEYYMTADGGEHWEVVTPSTPHTFEFPGYELRWRASFTGSDDRSARLFEITIDYEYAALAPIWWAVIGGGAGGLLLLVIIVIAVAVIAKKKKVQTR